jgi:hypothetical protein
MLHHLIQWPTSYFFEFFYIFHAKLDHFFLYFILLIAEQDVLKNIIIPLNSGWSWIRRVGTSSKKRLIMS